MDALDLLRRLHQHRAWVNSNLLAAAGALTDEQIHRAFAIGQGSVWKSLIHLFAAEFVWLETLLGHENPVAPGDLPGKIPGNQLGEEPFTRLDEFRLAWSALDRRWADYLATLSHASLDDLVHKIAFSTGQRMATRRADILMHLCTHAQYTSAQIVNMLRNLGVTRLPETMLITMARQELQ